MASPRLKVKQRSEAKESRGGAQLPWPPAWSVMGRSGLLGHPVSQKGLTQAPLRTRREGLSTTHPAPPDLTPTPVLPARDLEQAAAARRVGRCQAARGAGTSPQPAQQMLKPPAISRAGSLLQEAVGTLLKHACLQALGSALRSAHSSPEHTCKMSLRTGTDERVHRAWD